MTSFGLIFGALVPRVGSVVFSHFCGWVESQILWLECVYCIVSIVSGLFLPSYPVDIEKL